MTVQWMTILGGAQSGKTDLVHEICSPFDDVVWWGTGSDLPHDPDWQQRLSALRSARKSTWQTLDGPWAWRSEHAQAQQNLPPDFSKTKIFVLDSLNLWLAAELNRCTALYSMNQLRLHIELEFQQLMSALGALPCSVVIVSAEVGSGVVPSGEAGRLFRDLLGAWNRGIVARSHHGVSLHAGRALLWPGGLTPVAAEGSPVLAVDAAHLRRLLTRV